MFSLISFFCYIRCETRTVALLPKKYCTASGVPIFAVFVGRMIDSGRFGSNSPAWIPPFSHKRRSKGETFFLFLLPTGLCLIPLQINKIKKSE